MITIDDSEVRAELDILLGRMQDMAPLYKDVGVMQQNRITRRIETTKVAPSGILWSEWSLRRFTERQHLGNTAQGLLWDTGKLLNSIVAIVGDGVEIGTNELYAKNLQRDRPFVGWSPEDTKELELLSRLFMEGELV